MIRTETRRQQRRLIIDIRYKNPDGSAARFRRDAEVQTRAAAIAEERRRLVAIGQTGSPWGGSDIAPKLEDDDAPPASDVQSNTRLAPLFTEVANEFLGTFAESQFKPSTRAGYKKVINAFLVPRIGHLTVDAIDATVMRNLDAELSRRGVRNATRHNMQSVLRSVIRRFAVERGYLDLATIFPKLPKLGYSVLKVLTAAEVDAILTEPRRSQCTGERFCSAATLDFEPGRFAR